MKFTALALMAGLLGSGQGQQMSTSQFEYQFTRPQQNSQRRLGLIAEDFHAMEDANKYDVKTNTYYVCSDRDEMGPCTQAFNKKYASLLEETLEHKDANKPLHQVVNAYEEEHLVNAISMAAYYMYSPQKSDLRSLDDLARRYHNSNILGCFDKTLRPYYQEVDEQFVVNVHNVKEAGNFKLTDISFNDIKKVNVKERLNPQHNIKIQDLSMILDDCHKYSKANWHPIGRK